jgi:hypothetical protein
VKVTFSPQPLEVVVVVVVVPAVVVVVVVVGTTAFSTVALITALPPGATTADSGSIANVIRAVGSPLVLPQPITMRIKKQAKYTEIFRIILLPGKK